LTLKNLQQKEFLECESPEEFLENWSLQLVELKSKLEEINFVNSEFNENPTANSSSSNNNQLNLVESEVVKKITSLFQKKGNQTSSNNPSNEARKKENSLPNQKPNQKKKANSKNNLIILLPLGIPGMGKSTMLKQIKIVSEERNCSFRVLSNDETRRKLMDELQKKNKNKKVTHEELFEKTTKKTRNQFFKDLRAMIDQVSYMQEQDHIIFLDKNHPPQALDSTMSELQHISIPNVEIKVVAVIPLCYKNLRIHNKEYPFSENFILNCMSRAIKREGHQTLIGEPLKILNVVTMFVQQFRDFKFKGPSLSKLNIDYYIELPFTFENKEADENEIPANLSDALRALLKNYRFKELSGSGGENSIAYYSELSGLYEALQQTKSEFFKFVDPQYFGKFYADSLENIFKLFSEKRTPSLQNTPNSAMRPVKAEPVLDEEEKFQLE
jgi:hypothetical protein